MRAVRRGLDDLSNAILKALFCQRHRLGASGSEFYDLYGPSRDELVIKEAAKHVSSGSLPHFPDLRDSMLII